MSGHLVDSPVYAVSNVRDSGRSGSSRSVRGEHRPIFSSANRVPGFAAALRRDSNSSTVVSRIQIAQNRSIEG